MEYPHWSAAERCLKLSSDLNIYFILYVEKVSQATHSLWDLTHSNKMAWPYSSVCRIMHHSSQPLSWGFTPPAVLSCILPNILQAPGKWNILVYLWPSPQVFLYKRSKQLVVLALFPSPRRLHYSGLCQGSWFCISRSTDWFSWNIPFTESFLGSDGKVKPWKYSTESYILNTIFAL